jgi:hypothetical protein
MKFVQERFACAAPTMQCRVALRCKAQWAWRHGAACTSIAPMCAAILRHLQRTNALMKRAIGRERGMVCLRCQFDYLNYFVKSLIINDSQFLTG